MEVIKREVTTINLDGVHMVDIDYDPNKKMYEVYIYNVSRGFKRSMFGFPQDQPNAKDGHVLYSMDDIVEMMKWQDFDLELSIYYKELSKLNEEDE